MVLCGIAMPHMHCIVLGGIGWFSMVLYGIVGWFSMALDGIVRWFSLDATVGLDWNQIVD